MNNSFEKRILVADDQTSIHEDFRKILQPLHGTEELEKVKQQLFGVQKPEVFQDVPYTIDVASQGEEALKLVKKAKADGRPYAVAFIDIRMPPGWDGLTTIEHIWKVDPEVHIVICTAFSDYPWEEIHKRFHSFRQNLFVVKKPFDVIEIQQIASALTTNWFLKQQISYYVKNLEELVDKRTAELLHQSTHDSLTGLPNRLLLFDRLQEGINYTKRNLFKLALFKLEIVNYKLVQESYGEMAAERFLVNISTLISENLLRSNNTLARTGEYTFSILVNGLKVDDFYFFASRLLSLFEQPIDIREHLIPAKVSVGISIFPTDAKNVDHLMRNADYALHYAKETQQNDYKFYIPEYNINLSKKIKLRDDLEHALERNELMLHYQPLFNLESKVLGVEALARWFHPKHGAVSPSMFIPLAEESDLINKIGEWVIREACNQVKEWQKNICPDLHLAVNVSGQQIKQPHFFNSSSASEICFECSST